jgi:putative ABC transport system ATP-binding protein
MTPTRVLETRDIRKSYRRGPEEIQALKGVSLELAPGEVVALLGPSGSGKTTLFNILAGWESLDRGSLLWLGEALAPRTTLAWHELAIVPQSLGLIDELTVRENVDLSARLSASVQDVTPRVDLLLEALGLLGLSDRLPPETSLGEQQRTALARALLLEPRLLIADEPTGHQDAGWTKAVLGMFRSAAEGGTTCLLATHHRATVRYADRILAMLDGEVHEVDESEVILEGDDL